MSMCLCLTPRIGDKLKIKTVKKKQLLLNWGIYFFFASIGLALLAPFGGNCHGESMEGSPD